MASKKLHTDWLTEGLIDFEYKKYVLLAYFKEVDKAYNQTYLYPFLSDIIDHYRRLNSFKDEKNAFEDAFPKELKKVDWNRFMIEYENMLENSEHIKEIESIVEYALPKFEQYAQNGREIYDIIEDKIDIFPVGLISTYKDEGFVIMRSGMQDTQVFEYKVSLFESMESKFRTLKTNLIQTYQSTLTRTYEMIKKDILKERRDYSNPATYVIESPQQIPLEQTFIPIAKRRFMHYLLMEE